jgi:hypothetical protein
VSGERRSRSMKREISEVLCGFSVRPLDTVNNSDYNADGTSA